MTLPSFLPDTRCTITPQSRHGGLWEHWPQVIWYLPPCQLDNKAECQFGRRQVSEEQCWGNVKSRVSGLNIIKRLLNVEFVWDPEHLSNKLPLKGLPICITIDMVKRPSVRWSQTNQAIKSGKVVEMIRVAGDTGATMICHLATMIIWASTQQNLSSGFPTKRGSNQSPQLQRLARKLKFRL